jgi:hypothetical protein
MIGQVNFRGERPKRDGIKIRRSCVPSVVLLSVGRP